MAKEKLGRIMAIWSKEYGNATATLQRVRECAALTKPWVLPPLGQTEQQPLPQTYQSLGARGVTNLEGKMLMSLFPPELPWFELSLNPSIIYSNQVSDDFKNQAMDQLFWLEVIVQAALESAGLADTSARNDRRSGFQSRKRMALTQLLVTGDVLERMGDDYRITVFRRDQYVTHRDSCGDVMFHAIRERIDPMTLSDDQLETAGIKKEDAEDLLGDLRMQDLYTLVEWQPRTKKWKISQELNGHIINESEETVSQFFSTCYELAPGHNYGRGFIELTLPDLRTMDELEGKLLDFAGMCSKMHPVKDYASQVQSSDLELPPGSVLTARVVGGEVQDLAMFKPNNYPDFKVVYDTAERKRRDLGRAMLIDSEVIPSKERTTATQVRQIVQELDSATGGAYAPIADDQQLPLVRRTIHQLTKDKKIGVLPDGALNISIKTGLAALARQARLGNIVSFVTLAQQLGQEAMAAIDMTVLMDTARRYLTISEPTLVKSQARIAEDRKQQVMAQLTQAVNTKAADVVGNVAETALTGAVAA